MKTTYFTGCKCIEDLKELYRLCRKYHPDVSGTDTTEQMKAINAEYDAVFGKVKDIHRSTKDPGTTYTAAEETTETPQEFRDVINKIIHLDLDIEIIGSWIWVTGNTREYKDVLKAAGFRWCNNKVAWTWHREGERKKTHKQFNLTEIRDIFGTNKIEREEQRKLA